ncbi:MAG: glycine dehydrogenase (aminomethyl-transferring), partial [Phenylobacterium sp.]|nr:glycine dehydrogenase (aminomethyl-transferring) [Phenylobacterium sp.]
TMAHRISKSKSNAFFVSRDCHPQTIAVVRTRAEPLGWTVKVGDPARDLDPAAVFGALLQYPGTTGALRDDRKIIATLKDKGAVAVMAADPLALTLLTPPGELGADIAIGSMQRFGVPMGYGGPHAAYMAVRDALKRSLPGRIVGLSIDSRGAPAYRLALQTREQHIRREKATSNICTNSGLCALAFTIHMTLLGGTGLGQLARLNHAKARELKTAVEGAGLEVLTPRFFNEIAVRTRGPAAAAVDAALAHGVVAGVPYYRLDPHAGLDDVLLLCATETTTPEDIAALAAALKAA